MEILRRKNSYLQRPGLNDQRSAEEIRYTLLLMAKNINWRGASTPELEQEILLLQTQLDKWRLCPLTPDAKAPAGIPPYEYRDEWVIWLEVNIDTISRELSSRTQSPFTNVLELKTEGDRNTQEHHLATANRDDKQIIVESDEKKSK